MKIFGVHLFFLTMDNNVFQDHCNLSFLSYLKFLVNCKNHVEIIPSCGDKTVVYCSMGCSFVDFRISGLQQY